ncbi:MAG: type I-E CRISPR-associated protein Cse1/CasA [Coriobacteriales bacterium]|jgi:CRISPR system Cascade subunit CasA|nr:type I-E CRISPR-associated protein Cse1/CasA [Coriobacteriales bacterium]
MSSAEFNLVHEPWVTVMTLRGEVKDVSLLEVFERAHEYQSLAGELPTQDVAVLRLLLAILYATFARVDVRGYHSTIASDEEALDRWEQLWSAGSFPFEPIVTYLKSYEDRFYLFHPERPFYQVAGLTKGTEYQAAKLLGDLSESNNKLRFFPTRSGKAKERLSNAEAARWLLYLNGYDDTSAKPSVRGAGLPSVGAGWLGKLGLVLVKGDTLFETLLLNFALLDSNDEPFTITQATWELDEVHQSEREKIPIPTDPLELLTLQSRRILLKRKDGLVSGYLLLGGDFFDRENAFIEQMTMWRKDSNSQTDVYTPRRHSESRHVWREFPSLLARTAGQRQPGVVSWIATLRIAERLKKATLRLQVAGIQYADKDFYVDGIISDSLTMSTSLLDTLGADWIVEIVDLLNTTDQCVRQLGFFALDISESLGNDNDRNREGVKAAARERAFFALDIPFRIWLSGLDPTQDDHIEKQLEWIDRMQRIILSIAEDLIDEAGEKAKVGIYKVNESTAKSMSVNVFRAYRKFKNKVFRLCEVSERSADE